MALKQINTLENLAPGHLKYKDYNNGWQQLVVSVQRLPCQRCNLPFDSRDKSLGRGIKDFVEYMEKLGSHIGMIVCYLQQEKIQVLHFQRSIQWHKRLLFLIVPSTIYIYTHTWHLWHPPLWHFLQVIKSHQGAFWTSTKWCLKHKKAQNYFFSMA